FITIRRPPISPLFPYTTLFRSLELEIALLADKLDTTEECVRFRSHDKFFLDALANSEASGRKLNFLLQEMNREANTIGSKSNSVDRKSTRLNSSHDQISYAVFC